MLYDKILNSHSILSWQILSKERGIENYEKVSININSIFYTVQF
jgi:hypothetical protein